MVEELQKWASWLRKFRRARNVQKWIGEGWTFLSAWLQQAALLKRNAWGSRKEKGTHTRRKAATSSSERHATLVRVESEWPSLANGGRARPRLPRLELAWD